MSVTGDRRRTTRRSCSVRFSYFYRGQRREATMINASATGAFLGTTAAPPPGSILVLESFHDAARGVIIRFVVTVVRTRVGLTSTGVPGVGFEWKRGYCNRGAETLSVFLQEQLGFSLDCRDFVEQNPEAAGREVFYFFKENAFRLRQRGKGGSGYYHNPTPRTFLLVRDLPPSELSTAGAATELPPDDGRATKWRAKARKGTGPPAEKSGAGSTGRPLWPPPDHVWPGTREQQKGAAAEPSPAAPSSSSSPRSPAPEPAAVPSDPRRPSQAGELPPRLRRIRDEAAGVPPLEARPAPTRDTAKPRTDRPAWPEPPKERRSASADRFLDGILSDAPTTKEPSQPTWPPTRDQISSDWRAPSQVIRDRGERPGPPERSDERPDQRSDAEPDRDQATRIMGPAPAPPRASADVDVDTSDRASVKLGVTYSIGNRHFTGSTSHVGMRSLRVVTREAPPPEGNRVVVRLPIPKHVGYHIVRLSCRVTGTERDPLSVAGPTAIELQIQVIDDAANPGGFRKFVKRLMTPKD